MGYGYEFKCEQCNYKREYLLGHGGNIKIHEFETENMTKTELEINEIMKNEKVISYDSDVKLCVCKNCQRIYKKTIIELIYDKEGQIISKKSNFKCYKCKCTEYNDYKEEELSASLCFTCPKCGEKSYKEDGIIFWD